MKNYINVYDKSFQRIAILENADNIEYTTRMNELWTCRFRLPSKDPKNIHCQAFNYVEIFDNGKRVELFRILPSNFERNSHGYTSYDCEHVLATLLDTVLFGYHQIGNIGVYTSTVLRYLIDKQTIWKLGVCEFTHQFEYKWENENLLAALFSVPLPFVDKYIWSFDTTARPFTLNLKKVEVAPSCEVRYKKNMRTIQKHTDPTNIVTKLYCLGYGEGDNQLNIKSVNNGIPYLQAEQQFINSWGLRESIWIDRRYESPETLKAAGLAMLNELKQPYITYKTTALELRPISNSDYDEYRAGKLVKVVDKEDGIEFTAFITETSKNIMSPEVDITIANKERDIGSSVSDLQSRSRINEAYSQGSTNMYALTFADNADQQNPAIMKVYIPPEAVRINKCILNFGLEPFRAYSKSVSATQQTTSTTSSGGGTSTTTSSGGGKSATTSSGGGSYPTSGADNYYSSSGGHNHGIDRGVRLLIEGGGYVTWVPSGNHNHNIKIQDHRHDFYIDDHDHGIQIPAHQHEITIPGHSHDMQFGIFRGTVANSVSIKVDGQWLPPITSNELNIIPYLGKDSGGKITRGVFHIVEIYPNTLTRIIANVFLQTFLNSRGAGDY